MNKKTLSLLALEIKDNVAYTENRKVVANVIIEVATKVNSRFNKDKFLKECGLKFDI
jgi:hypothetical protein